MSGLNLIPIQDDIASYIAAQFPNYEVIEDMLLDEETVLRNNNNIKPYIVLRWGGLWALGSKSIAGVRFDEYSSTVDIAVVAPKPRQCRVSLNAILDTMIGWKPADGTPLYPQGSNTLLAVENANGKPAVYIASSRLVFGVNAENVGGYISH
jgi:hypothetical protein